MFLAPQQHGPLIPVSSSEFPFLDSISIDFWARKGLQALRTSNGIETKHIIQFIPIKDQHAVENVLQSRWDSELDSLLAAERGVFLSDTSLTQRHLAQELITLLLPPQQGNISWAPLNPSAERPVLNAEDIRDAVVNIICKIGFGDWARYVFGIEVPALTAFFQWASNVSNSLRARYTAQKEHYEEVERVCYIIIG